MTITGDIDLSAGVHALWGHWNEGADITIREGASFHAGAEPFKGSLYNYGTISGGTFDNEVEVYEKGTIGRRQV